MKESPIFVKTYDFTKWLFEHTIKFPKSQRFVMAKRINNEHQDNRIDFLHFGSHCGSGGNQIIPTASLPAGGAAVDGTILIEDGGAGVKNLIIYGGGQRFRINGGTAF